MVANTSGNNGSAKSDLLLVTILMLTIVIVGDDSANLLHAENSNSHTLVAGVLDAEYTAPIAEPITPASVNTPGPEAAAATCTLERDAQERKVCNRQAQETKQPYVLSKLVTSKDGKPNCEYGCTLECPVGQELIIYTGATITGGKKLIRQCADTNEGGGQKKELVDFKDSAGNTHKVPQKLIDDYNTAYGDQGTANLAEELHQASLVAGDNVAGNPADIARRKLTAFNSNNTDAVFSGETTSSLNTDSSSNALGSSNTINSSIKSINDVANQSNSVSNINSTPNSFGNPNPVQTTGNGSPLQHFGNNQNNNQMSQLSQQSQSPYQNLQSSPWNYQKSKPVNPLDRLTQFFGNKGLFNGQTPNFVQTEQQQPIVVYVGKPVDAHIRDIQAIAYDVTQQQTVPTDTRIESFEKTLTVVGGVHTSGRATTTVNSEYGRILDLITEDQAIKALEVAEQTGLRVRNRVYCVEQEKSKDCLLRRNDAAKRVERQTFITELENSNGISQADLEHFLAVYDGWVSPYAPRPLSQPVSLLNAPDNIDTAENNITATSTPGFIARAVSGISNGVQKIVDALISWLTS